MNQCTCMKGVGLSYISPFFLSYHLNPDMCDFEFERALFQKMPVLGQKIDFNLGIFKPKKSSRLCLKTFTKKTVGQLSSMFKAKGLVSIKWRWHEGRKTSQSVFPPTSKIQPLCMRRFSKRKEIALMESFASVGGGQGTATFFKILQFQPASSGHRPHVQPLGDSGRWCLWTEFKPSLLAHFHISLKKTRDEDQKN